MQNKQQYTQEEKLLKTFRTVKPIVLKAMTQYKIRLWDTSDYIQEGMLLCHKLLEEDIPERRFCAYFKVRYLHQLMDILRISRADKRTYDNYEYYDITELDFQVSEGDILLDQYLDKELEKEFISTLKIRDHQAILKLLRGEKIERAHKHRLKKKFQKFLSNAEEDDEGLPIK